MSQESSATELEVAMLYSDVLAESDDENDVWLRRLHEGVAVAKALVAERKAAASGGGASSFGSASQLKRPAPDGAQSASAADAPWWRAFFQDSDGEEEADVAEREAAVRSGGGAGSFGSPSQLKRPATSPATDLGGGRRAHRQVHRKRDDEAGAGSSTGDKAGVGLGSGEKAVYRDTPWGTVVVPLLPLPLAPVAWPVAQPSPTSAEAVTTSCRATLQYLVECISSGEERRLALLVLARLDAVQVRAAYAVLVVKKQLVVISGPAGSGKSELLKLFAAVVGRARARVVAPTQGARRVCQQNIDEALPRASFKPQLEAMTTFVGFGNAWGEQWQAKQILRGLQRAEARRSKAADLYDNASLVIADEGAQTPVEHFETADLVARERRQRDELMGGMQLVVLMDAVQSGPVGTTRVLWQAPFFVAAEAAGLVDVFALEKVYRTDEPRLLELFAALRAEDVERSWPLVEAALDEVAARHVTHIVHDNEEIYPIAEDVHNVEGAVAVEARSELGGPGGAPRHWSTDERRALRAEAKLLVLLYLSVGQLVEYAPVGETAATTTGGWRLIKGEVLRVLAVNGVGADVKVTVQCVNLPRAPSAVISEADVWVKIGGSSVKIWALPLRYLDIVTVYSAQGSQYENVHVHVGRFKLKRNLLYTAVTRAMKSVRISGIKTKLDLQKKMELSPMTVLWQAERGGQQFSAERLEAARRDAARMRQ